MAFETIHYRQWTFLCDPEETRAIYARITGSVSERCKCDYCYNWNVAREAVIPAEIKSLFEQMGIDYRKNGDVSQLRRLKNGNHEYMGIYNFVGEVTRFSPPPQEESPEISNGFCLAGYENICTPALSAPEFDRKGIAEITFLASVPWVCDKPDPEIKST